MSEVSEFVKILEWDSRFFGKLIGRVSANTLTPAQASEIDQWAKLNRVDCLYFLAAANEQTSSQTAEDFGYHLTDVRVTLSHRTNREAEMVNHPANIREAKPSDIDALKRIAHDAHRDSRFFFDGHFDPQKCAELYEIWIEKSVHGSSNVVWVWDESDRPVGYVTGTALPDGTGSIGLVGVDPNFQGKRIGHQLIHKLLEWFAARKIDPVLVVTQGRNVKAQAFYQRCGFTTHSVELWYHKWYR